jgi:uncharacterized membrane protein (DUF485 family)
MKRLLLFAVVFIALGFLAVHLVPKHVWIGFVLALAGLGFFTLWYIEQLYVQTDRKRKEREAKKVEESAVPITEKEGEKSE